MRNIRLPSLVITSETVKNVQIIQNTRVTTYNRRFLGYFEAFQIIELGGGKLTFQSAHHINKATLVVWVYVYMGLGFTFSNLYANALITQRNGAPGKLDRARFSGLLTHFFSTHQLVSN